MEANTATRSFNTCVKMPYITKENNENINVIPRTLTYVEKIVVSELKEVEADVSKFSAETCHCTLQSTIGASMQTHICTTCVAGS